MATQKSAYEATARTRAQLRAQAALNGWEVLDVLGAFLTPDGECIVITKDGRRFGIVISADLTPVSEKSDPATKHKPRGKVYAPASWDADKWNGIIASIREMQMARDAAMRDIAHGKTLDDKQKRQALAVFDAMPDVPDWYDHLPLAETGA